MIVKPNYTQVPNEILDNQLSKMSCAEIKVFLTICRKTIGWHKDTDAVSYTQLMEATGLARAAVATAIKALEKKELIKVDRAYKRTSLYTIWFENQTTAGLESEPENEKSGLKSEHTKDIYLNKVKEIPPKNPADIISLPPKQKKDTSIKDAFFKTWNECFLAETEIPYTWLDADWAQYARYKADDIGKEKLVSLVRAWFAIPEKDIQYYPREVKAFFPKLAKASALAKSTKSSKDDFNKISGWDGK